MIYDIIKTVRFEYCDGDSTATSIGTPWRILPEWVIVHSTGSPSSISLDDGEYKFGSKYAIIIPPNTRHKFAAPKNKSNISRWCHANFRLSNGLDISHFIDVPLIWQPGPDTKTIAKLNEKMGQITHCDFRNDLNLSLELLECGMTMLRLIAAKGKLKVGQSIFRRESLRMMPILEFIDDNLSQPLSRDQLAKMAGLSPSRFHTVFSNFIGTGPMEFVRSARMAKACRLLKETSLQISKIAAEVGYEDQYIFSRAFKGQIGISPMGYRKQPISTF